MTELLVGTATGLVATGGGRAGPEGPIDALAADRWGTWALVDDHQLWRGVRDHWVRVTDIEGPPGRCLLGTDDGLYVGTAEAGLLHLEDGVLRRVKGFDDAPGRESWYTPWGGPPDTRSMSQGADGALYANVHVGGILRSDDGDRWEPTIEVDADVHRVLAHPDDPALILAAAAPGMAVSRDRGATWTITADGLHAPYCRAVAVTGDDVLVTASTGPFTDRAAVYRRPLDSGGPFERCTDGLPDWFPSNIDSLCLAARGDDAAFGTSEGEVYRSSDGGRSWERTATGLADVSAVLFA
jgi:hypothetical protein